MSRLAALLAAPAAILLMAAAPPEWANKDDIPVPGPVSVGLAGSGEVDTVRYFLAQGPGNGALSPDGRWLVYLSKITGKPQVWIVDTLKGGAPRQLTYGLGVDAAVWMPDGKSILYSADRGGDERYGYYRVTPDGFQEAVLFPPSEAFIYFGDFSSDGQRVIYGSTARNGRDFDLYSASVAGGDIKPVMQGRMGFYPYSAQPKGSLMVVLEARGEAANDASLVDLATGKETSLFKPKEPAAYDGFEWTPDGKGFYLTTDEGREFAALAHYDLATGQTKIVDAPSADVVAVLLSPDGRYLIWSTDEGGFHTLQGRDLKTGKPLKIPPMQPGTYGLSSAERAAVVTINVKGPATPGEIWRWDLATGKAAMVVAPDAAGLDLSKMAIPTVVRFKARDGVPLSGLLYRPKNAKGKVPVYLRLHGGPTSHARADWKPEIQNLVANGYAVLDFNYRGSDGAGKTLATLNDRRLRVNELGDLIDAVGWINQQPGLDGSRVAVGGASYGGYLTNAVLGAHPGVFVAGVSEVGVADWVRNLQDASPQLKASDRLEYGDIDNPDDRAFFASISPINNAGKIKDPLLLQAGANDPRNGIGEHDEFITAIRKAGGVVIYRRYNGEGHQMTDLANIVDYNRTKAAFLKEHFK